MVKPCLEQEEDEVGEICDVQQVQGVLDPLPCVSRARDESAPPRHKCETLDKLDVRASLHCQFHVL
jgi:hypothetical protein